MVIKIQTADSSHGHNAINYAMNKKRMMVGNLNLSLLVICHGIIFW